MSIFPHNADTDDDDPDFDAYDIAKTNAEQVTKLVTAIFLIMMGALIEYSNNIDWYVLMTGLFVGFFKICLAAYIWACLNLCK